MTCKTNFEFLFIGKEDEGIAKNYYFEKEGTSGKETEKIFVTFEMLSNQVLAEEIGEGIFSTVKNKFFREEGKEAYLRFEEALKEVNNYVLDLQKKKEIKFIPTVNIVVVALSGMDLFLTQAGEAEAYLVRRKHVSIISEGLSEEENQNELFSNIANGTLEIGDTVVFSSAKLLRYITEIDLGKIFSHYSLTEALNELKRMLKREVTTRVSVLALEIQEKEVVPMLKEIKEKEETKIIERRKRGSSLKQFLHERMDSWQRFFKSKTATSKSIIRKLSIFKKNKLLILIVVLSVFLISSVYIIKVKGVEKRKIEEYTATLTELRTDVDSAQTKALLDKKQADNLLLKAEEQAKKIAGEGYLRSEVSQLLERIQLQRDKLDNVIRISDGKMRVWADLSQKRANISALGLLSTSDKLYVYEYNALYEVILNKVEDPLTIDDSEVVIAGNYFADRGSLVFLTKSNRIIEYSGGQFSFMDTEDAAWHGGTDIGTFSQWLYIFDPDNNQIWKYARKRDKYSAATPYITEGDIKEGFSMGIDGSIYVLKKNGIIEVLYRGKKHAVSVKKEPLVALNNPKAIYTEAEMSEIYVLDPNNRRVVVYTKNPSDGALIYARQYVFANGTEAFRDLYVDKKDQKLYLLSEKKVHEMDLSGTN